MKHILSALLITVFILPITGQGKKKKQDIEAIKSMCGCYEVSFNFVETFNYNQDSTYAPSKTKHDKGLEWAQLVEEDKDKVSIQHLLIVGPKEHPYIVKHWRQDWLYQNQDLYNYNGDNNWIYKHLTKDAVKGQWTQKVFQVDDSPRYEGSSTWVHVDGKSYWENTTDAPLPRREYTTRADYNVTERGNRHQITNEGWVHDQDNKKILRESGKDDIIIAEEKGYNVYKKVADSECKAAADWWIKNQAKWQLVRNKWDDVYGKNKNLSLHEKVDNKVLYKYLFSEDYSDKDKIETVIDSFVIE